MNASVTQCGTWYRLSLLYIQSEILIVHLINVADNARLVTVTFTELVYTALLLLFINTHRPIYSTSRLIVLREHFLRQYSYCHQETSNLGMETSTKRLIPLQKKKWSQSKVSVLSKFIDLQNICPGCSNKFRLLQEIWKKSLLAFLLDIKHNIGSCLSLSRSQWLCEVHCYQNVSSFVHQIQKIQFFKTWSFDYFQSYEVKCIKVPHCQRIL